MKLLEDLRKHKPDGVEHNITLTLCPALNASRRAWVKWIHEVESVIKGKQTTLSARTRRKKRCEINKKVAEREAQSKLGKQLKKFLNYALNRNGGDPKPTVSREDTPSGTVIHDTKEGYHKHMRKHTCTHMGKGRKRW